MAKFYVNVSWKMFGFYEIEADNKEQAKQTALEKQSNPDNSQYSKGSFEVDSIEEVTEENP